MRALVVGAVLLLSIAHAQTPVELTVVDGETGDPLPGATAQSRRDGAVGAAADRDGRLRLSLPSVPDTLVVRFLGYAPAQVVVTGPDARRVRLSQDVRSLGEVVVSTEPLGERIWRRVLARREVLARRLVRYGAEAYSRLLLLRDGPLDAAPVPVSLAETVSNVSWDARRGAREEVVARRRVPARPFRYAPALPVSDLYFEDALALDGGTVPSPTAADALDNYAFRLGETVEADGRRYLDLAVVPRRRGLLAGRIRIVDSLFVIAEADLRLDGPPTDGAVQDLDAGYRWTYTSVWTDAALRDSVWLPSAFTREGEVIVGVPGRTVPTVRFRQTSRLTLVVPRGDLPAETGGRRYRSPRGVYAGAGPFRAGRAALPLDRLETAADTTRRLRSASWASLLPPQTGLQLTFGLPGVSRALGLDLDGADDP